MERRLCNICDFMPVICPASVAGSDYRRKCPGTQWWRETRLEKPSKLYPAGRMRCSGTDGDHEPDDTGHSPGAVSMGIATGFVFIELYHRLYRPPLRLAGILHDAVTRRGRNSMVPDWQGDRTWNRETDCRIRVYSLFHLPLLSQRPLPSETAATLFNRLLSFYFAGWCFERDFCGSHCPSAFPAILGVSTMPYFGSGSGDCCSLFQQT